MSPLTPEQLGAISSAPNDRTFVFISGLHRSGTTLLARCLGDHPQASGFSETGAIEDEGQFLQSVYPLARRYGGPGLFGFAPEMHITEDSPLVSEENRRILYTEWRRYWNLERQVLIEKSPPNLLKTRFLQAMFPHTRFVMVLRHPIATSLATQKGSHTSFASLLEHWLVCYELMQTDLIHLRNVTILRYEDLVSSGDTELMRIHEFMGLAPIPYGLEPRKGLNEAYFARWRTSGSMRARRRRTLEERFELRVNHFGYSLRDPESMLDREDVTARLLAERTTEGMRTQISGAR